MSFDKPLLPQGAELVKPPTRVMVYLSLLVALAATLSPWDANYRWLLPDFTLLLLLYWNIRAPRMVGLGTAFTLGLVSDVARGMLMGLNALAYCAATLTVLLLHRRLENFDAARQTPQIAPILVGKEAIVLTFGLMIGRGDMDWRWLLAGVVGALLWTPISWLMDRVSARPSTPARER